MNRIPLLLLADGALFCLPGERAASAEAARPGQAARLLPVDLKGPSSVAADSKEHYTRAARYRKGSFWPAITR